VPASAQPETSGEGSILGGNQVLAPINLAIDVTCNAIASRKGHPTLHSGPTARQPPRARREEITTPSQGLVPTRLPVSVDAWWTRASNLPSTVLAEQGQECRPVLKF
jgi:hypothetical protein